MDAILPTGQLGRISLSRTLGSSCYIGFAKASKWDTPPLIPAVKCALRKKRTLFSDSRYFKTVVELDLIKKVSFLPRMRMCATARYRMEAERTYANFEQVE